MEPQGYVLNTRRRIAHSRPGVLPRAARGAGDPRPRGGGRREAGVGGPARVEPLAPGAVRQVLDDATRLAPAEAEGRGELARAQAQEVPRRRRRPQGPAERGGG